MTHSSHTIRYYPLLAVIYAGAFQNGGASKFYIAFTALTVGVLVCWIALVSKNLPCIQKNSRLRLSTIAFALCILIGIVQCLPFSFGNSAVLYAQASDVLHLPLHSFISIAPQETYIGLLRLLTYAAVFWLGLSAGINRLRAIRLLTTMACLGGICGIASLYEYDALMNAAANGGNVFTPPVYILSMIRNHFADFMSIHLIIALALGVHAYEHFMERNRSNRLSEIINGLIWYLLPVVLLVLVLGVALILSISRAGILSGFLGVLVLSLLLSCSPSRMRNASQTPIFSIATVVVFTGLFFLCGTQAAERYTQMGQETARRLQLDRDTIPMIASFPLLGSGIDTYAQSYKAHGSEAILYLFDKDVETERAHNGYVETMATLGIPGFLLLMVAIMAIIFHCLQGIFVRHHHKTIPAAGVAVATALGFHALSDFSLQIPTLASLLAFTLGIAFARAFPEERSA